MLRIDRLTAGYGGPPIISEMSLEIPAGEVLAILGRNGSGKSTLLKAVMGLLPHVSGIVKLFDRLIAGLPTHRIARAGVGYVPQGRGIFPRLTVLENLRTGTRARADAAPRIPEHIFAHFPVLKERLGQYGGTLSGGEQQMLAIARALCGEPRVLLMDEPTDGIAPAVVASLADLIPALARGRQLSIVLVEQNVDLALAAANRCAVMEKGSIVHCGPPATLDDPELLKRYLAI